MKIRVIKIGKPAHKSYQPLVDTFIKRLQVMASVESVMMKAHEGKERSERELARQLDLGPKNTGQHRVIALDERGRSMSTQKLTSFIRESSLDGSIKNISLLVGGPYGLTDKTRQEADDVWKLSDMVMPSDMAWLILWEQLYRAYSIIKGTAYHHDG